MNRNRKKSRMYFLNNRTEIEVIKEQIHILSQC